MSLQSSGCIYLVSYDRGDDGGGNGNVSWCMGSVYIGNKCFAFGIVLNVSDDLCFIPNGWDLLQKQFIRYMIIQHAVKPTVAFLVALGKLQT